MFVAVCDDNKEQRLAVVNALRRNDCVDNVIGYDSTEKLIEAFMETGFNLIVLETKTPCMNGLEAAACIRNIDPNVHIIFVTQSPQYCLEAFSVYAADYLLKPADLRKLNSTLQRINRRVEEIDSRVIEIKKQNVIYRIKQNEIIMIEKVLDKCVVYTEDFAFEVTGSLKYFEDTLDKDRFVRSHSGYLVNINKILSIESNGNLKYTLHLKGTNKTAILSRGKRQCIPRKVEGWWFDDTNYAAR